VAQQEVAAKEKTEAAKGELSASVLAALGPDVTLGEIEGARRMLRLMLAALPYYERYARGDAEAQP